MAINALVFFKNGDFSRAEGGESQDPRADTGDVSR